MNLLEILFTDSRRTVACRVCGRLSSAYDVASGWYVAETGTCHDCYRAMALSVEMCFAKQYQAGDPQCDRWCEDSQVCRTWLAREKRMSSDRQRKRRLLAVIREALPEASRKSPKLESHPFPIRTSVVRVAWELAIRGTTLDRLRQFCQDVGADSSYVLRELRRGAKGRHRWTWDERQDGSVRIVYEKAL